VPNAALRELTAPLTRIAFVSDTNRVPVCSATLVEKFAKENEPDVCKATRGVRTSDLTSKPTTTMSVAARGRAGRDGVQYVK